MLNVGPQELLVLLVIALLVVGPQRLPELSRQIGRGLRELRKLQDDVKGMVDLDEIKGMVGLDEVKNMVNFSTDTPAEGASATKRLSETTAAPGVHRAPRPAPGPDGEDTTAPTPGADAAQDG